MSVAHSRSCLYTYLWPDNYILFEKKFKRVKQNIRRGLETDVAKIRPRNFPNLEPDICLEIFQCFRDLSSEAMLLGEILRLLLIH